MLSGADASVCSFRVGYTYTDIQQVWNTVCLLMYHCGIVWAMNFTSLETLHDSKFSLLGG